MGISPWIKSQFKAQLAPLWEISLETDSGTVDLSGLSDSDLSIYFKNIINAIEIQGAGTLHIVQSNPGIVSYQVNVADVVIGFRYWRMDYFAIMLLMY